MDVTLEEFLQRKGAIGILTLLHERPMTYSEIEPEIEVTSSTIVTRRDEAAKLGLIDVSLGRGEVGTKKVYTLTDMGEFLTDKMAREGILSNYRKMRTLQQVLDEQTESITQWMKENPSQLLQFETADDGTVISRDEMKGNSDGETSTQSSPSPNEREEAPDADKYTSNLDDPETEPPERPSEGENFPPEEELPVDLTPIQDSDSETSDTETDDSGEAADDSPSGSHSPSERAPDSDQSADSEELGQEKLEEISYERYPPNEEDDDTDS
ncbi:hypothetical protein R3751_16425 [Halorubrum distributum]|uniref:hypothetical protein n=1 Tax=Halorubrum distributum TaxID=29283 RepID=UPI002952CFD9|nr:hypothetical protein [Halorubrum distributum]MDV7351351.1 hypothetical protein [Halorubrum distributum]